MKTVVISKRNRMYCVSDFDTYTPGRWQESLIKAINHANDFTNVRSKTHSSFDNKFVEVLFTYDESQPLEDLMSLYPEHFI